MQEQYHEHSLKRGSEDNTEHLKYEYCHAKNCETYFYDTVSFQIHFHSMSVIFLCFSVSDHLVLAVLSGQGSYAAVGIFGFAY